MPETAMNEYRQLVAMNHDIWRSCNIFHVEPISQAPRPQETTHHHLRPRVLAVYGGHYLATLFLASGVHVLNSYGTPLSTYGEYL